MALEKLFTSIHRTIKELSKGEVVAMIRSLEVDVVQAINSLFKGDNPILASEEIKDYLIQHNIPVPRGRLNEILEMLEGLGCIRVVKWLGRDAVEEHGNMTITAINPPCLWRFEKIVH